jgi:hypothetical protein
LTETAIPSTEAAQGQLYFVLSTILRRKAGAQRKYLEVEVVVVVVVVEIGVKVLVNRGGLLHPLRPTVQDSDAIQDIQGIDGVVRVLDLELHIAVQDAIVLLPP